MNTPTKPRNIYIIGAHCTGKTTLIEALKKHLSAALVSEIFGEGTKPPFFIDEVVREVMHRDGFSSSHVRHLTHGLQLQLNTLLEQYRAEESLGDQWFVADRSGIDALTYATVFPGRHAAGILCGLHEWYVLREKMRDALVIVCEPSNETWLSSDNVRVECMRGEWTGIGETFHVMLRSHQIEYVAIPKEMEDLSQRVQFVEHHLRSTVAS